MRVHWTDTAQEHLDAIHAYIAQDSPEYAKRMIDRLTRRSQQIAGFPLSGRRVPEYAMDPIREVIEESRGHGAQIVMGTGQDHGQPAAATGFGAA